jgi:hypothetical protein
MVDVARNLRMPQQRIQYQGLGLSDHLKSDQRLSVQNPPTTGGRNIYVLPCYSLSRQV